MTNIKWVQMFEQVVLGWQHCHAHSERVYLVGSRSSQRSCAERQVLPSSNPLIQAYRLLSSSAAFVPSCSVFCSVTFCNGVNFRVSRRELVPTETMERTTSSYKGDNVCRLCLSTRGEIRPIFSSGSSSDESASPVLASKIEECVSVKVKSTVLSVSVFFFLQNEAKFQRVVGRGRLNCRPRSQHSPQGDFVRCPPFWNVPSLSLESWCVVIFSELGIFEAISSRGVLCVATMFFRQNQSSGMGDLRPWRYVGVSSLSIGRPRSSSCRGRAVAWPVRAVYRAKRVYGYMAERRLARRRRAVLFSRYSGYGQTADTAAAVWRASPPVGCWLLVAGRQLPRAMRVPHLLYSLFSLPLPRTRIAVAAGGAFVDFVWLELVLFADNRVGRPTHTDMHKVCA